MIPAFVKLWEYNKPQVRAELEKAHPKDYVDIVKAVVRCVSTPNYYRSPDPERITEIILGSYQGTKLYIICANEDIISPVWYVKVGYGSCPVCDTLSSIRDLSYDVADPAGAEKPTKEQVDRYMTLALHIVQNLKELDGEIV